ncbi:MAG: hypothetical protein ACYC5N_11335 [Endomicrobiales bacterium]
MKRKEYPDITVRFLPPVRGFLVFLLLLAAGPAQAEDEVDRFILPETPPTIERLKKPPLDQPVLRKQNFVSESDITLPPVLLALKFSPLYSERYPVSVGIWKGSFSSLGGSFAVATAQGLRMRYAADYSEGQYPRQARETNIFGYEGENYFGSDVKVNGSLDAGEYAVWTGHKNFVRLRTAAEWHAQANMDVKALLSYERGEIKAMEAGESFRGSLSLDWQPRDGHNVSFAYVPEKDTAFTAAPSFSTLDLKYTFMAGSRVLLGAGCRSQQDRLFPQAEVTWHVIPRMRMRVGFQPGIEKPSWRELYINERYVRSVPSLAFPEDSFRLSESVSYYWGENGSAEIEFSQADRRNHVYWRKEAGTEYLVPDNEPERYLSSWRLGVRHAGKVFSPRASFSYASYASLPLVPEYTLSAAVECSWRSWALTPGYDFVSARAADKSGGAPLGSYGDISLKVVKTLPAGIEVFAEGNNLLGQKIETQPGFFSDAPAFRGGTTVRF